MVFIPQKTGVITQDSAILDPSWARNQPPKREQQATHVKKTKRQIIWTFPHEKALKTVHNNTQSALKNIILRGHTQKTGQKPSRALFGPKLGPTWAPRGPQNEHTSC